MVAILQLLGLTFKIQELLLVTFIKTIVGANLILYNHVTIMFQVNMKAVLISISPHLHAPKNVTLSIQRVIVRINKESQVPIP